MSGLAAILKICIISRQTGMYGLQADAKACSWKNKFLKGASWLIRQESESQWIGDSIAGKMCKLRVAGGSCSVDDQELSLILASSN